MKLLEMFRNWKDVQEYDAQTVIFSSGGPTDVLYFILSGEVELTLHGESLGTEVTGGIIGEMAMIPSARQSSTATAVTAVRLARFDYRQLKEFVSDNTDFSLHLMAALASRLRAVDQYITRNMKQIG
jgi:CRP-like cAMP-binding protein